MLLHSACVCVEAPVASTVHTPVTPQVYTAGGYTRMSDVTETEDVSYVSSPYLPECLRGDEKPMTDNSNRAHESAAGESDLKDELSEAITLSNVVAMVGE